MLYEKTQNCSVTYFSPTKYIYSYINLINLKLFMQYSTVTVSHFSMLFVAYKHVLKIELNMFGAFKEFL
jgi:hypothetical protein